MPSILDAIVARKQDEVRAARQRVSLVDLERAAASASPPRDFFAAVTAPGAVRLIAEFKRRSPSAGPIRPGAEVARVVSAYAAAEAAGIPMVFSSHRHFRH